MSEITGLRLSASAALKEKRLAALRHGRESWEPRLCEAIEDAQALGSLELAGFGFSWDEIQASRRGEVVPAPVTAIHRAQRAVDPGSPFSVSALLAWHATVLGSASAFRLRERARDDAPPPAPPEFIASRLAILEEWMNAESGRELKPAQQGGLVLARLVEILPFEDANGRVSRLAASHLMVRAGARPPILVGADRPRLVHALQAAFQLHMEPLCALLEEASERSLDVMLQVLDPPNP